MAAAAAGALASADSLETWTQEALKKEQALLEGELVKRMSDKDPGALLLKNVGCLQSVACTA